MSEATRSVVRLVAALVALCAAGACLPLAVGAVALDVPLWVLVAGGLAGLCSAAMLLLGKPWRQEALAHGLDFLDEMSASRNAELHDELLVSGRPSAF